MDSERTVDDRSVDDEEPDGDLAGDGAGAALDEELPENPNVADLLDELEELRLTLDDAEEREQLSRTVKMASRIPGSSTFGKHIDKYTGRDVAEAFVGSMLVAVPMLVEDVSEIGGHFATNPAFFVTNVAFVVLMTIGLLYWADIQQVEITNPIFGVVPRRLVGVLVVSLITATFTMTLWGRIDPFGGDLWLTICDVSVLWSAGAFGAALGDILPGESKGTDLSELDDRLDLP